jgi:cell division protein FtsB
MLNMSGFSSHRPYRSLLLGTVSLLILSYIAYHLFSGDRGLVALIRLSKTLDEMHLELDQVRVERLNLEHKVSLLRPSSLDLDLLDEQSRLTLGYAERDERILFAE